MFRPPWYFKKIFYQIIDIGYFSLPVVGLTTFFSGMVLALQTYNGFSEFNNETTPTLPRYKKVLHCGSTIFGQTRLITNIILYAYFTDFGCADSIVLDPCYQNRRDVSL